MERYQKSRWRTQTIKILKSSGNRIVTRARARNTTRRDHTRDPNTKCFADDRAVVAEGKRRFSRLEAVGWSFSWNGEAVWNDRKRSFYVNHLTDTHNITYLGYVVNAFVKLSPKYDLRKLCFKRVCFCLNGNDTWWYINEPTARSRLCVASDRLHSPLVLHGLSDPLVVHDPWADPLACHGPWSALQQAESSY